MPARVTTAGGRAKRFGSGRIHRQGQRARLEVEQGALVLEPAAEAGQRAVAADDAVARADDRRPGCGRWRGRRRAPCRRGRCGLRSRRSWRSRRTGSSGARSRRAARRRSRPRDAARGRSPCARRRSTRAAGRRTGSKRGSSEASPAPKPRRVSAPSSSTVRASGPTGESMVVCMLVITGDRPLA